LKFGYFFIYIIVVMIFIFLFDLKIISPEYGDEKSESKNYTITNIIFNY
jgi:hypothetical protein